MFNIVLSNLFIIFFDFFLNMINIIFYFIYKKEFYRSMKEKNSLVTCEASADKLYQLLLENKYESGTHFDYYDPLP